ncbi:MAG TPA: cell division protein SepF [Firmicutes bacterium]|uniref:Cell division protein SepF n=1 Tax=Capillibacterium thermochitinicola TaxID=2699427 RepID=A0A8J6HYZ5_9FIRM|nr:cell division protein SepF [Capillibacterium thermochitinicola]MBA2132625.1 cell division protein SepF [Capillibacterium thermochitinicola]HHW12798.1 cell division protein SepF [Bacillota bacterium]
MKTPGNEEWAEAEGKKSFLERLMNLLGFETQIEVEEVDDDPVPGMKEVNQGKERGKVVSLSSPNKTTRLVVYEPRSFDDVQSIVNQLKNKRPVILNLEETDKAVARRITDFVGGAVYALDGGVQKVSSSIMLFTPLNVEVSFPLRSETERNPYFNTDFLER